MQLGDKWEWTQHPDIFEWVQTKIKQPMQLQPNAQALVYRPANGIAVAIYNSYAPQFESIGISIAGEGNWAQRDAMATFVSVPFRMLPIYTLRCVVAKGNKKSRRLVEHVGFTLDGKIRKPWGSQKGDAMVYSMMRRDRDWETF